MRAFSYFPWSLQLSLRARRRFAVGLPPAVSPTFRLRLLAQRLRSAEPAATGSAAALQLLARLNEALRMTTLRYLEQKGCTVALNGIQLGAEVHPFASLTPTLEAFVRLFPPGTPAESSPKDPRAWLLAAGDASRPTQALIELQVLAVQNENRATRPLQPLFDDAELRAAAPYPALLSELDGLLLPVEAPGLFALPLTELLRLPLRRAPDSLAEQLRYVRVAWGAWLPPELLDEIDAAFDLLAEEEQARGRGPGPQPVLAPGHGLGYDEPERFSPDTDWMPNVVMLAKTIYVWLHQLSRRYGRPIERLDQIPDEELTRLSRSGFTALWLIGIWERSPASAEIKRRMGNPEAAASAYSLFDYVVAADLGGEEALQGLRARCQACGLRLACDVVPNHTGLDSRWVREHPDWYVQVDHPPYPAYQFTGPNLSGEPGLELRIEDGYWSHRDAAVVFQHIRDGRVRYLYHGNDGTHLPWNDTAQLNFLLPQVREAMIGLIVAVARRFPIIRFDAAMTLAKKHYQRLWFPQPGGGAGVPSRAEHAMSRPDFEAVFPVEFWREVVDRVAAEVPDTLLLAEAFWLMEGYFVRTLGMHRVYNSAFMNMLKHEENAKYRAVLKNILAFEPEILKRFVNFMNNPDEETAVAQFGKGDKYFGVAVLLATLPGLPMFGHGQLEGLEEKYGMEYRRAYRDEEPDEGFMRHHEEQVFPLLLRRGLFSGSEDFELYDCSSTGGCNENVFAFSNRRDGARGLVLYHNCAGEATGRLAMAVEKRTLDGSRSASLEAGLALAEAPYWRCRELKSGREHLFTTRQLAESGLAVQLGPYDYRVYLDWQPLPDDGCWGEVQRRLGDAGSHELDRLWGRQRYAELHAALRQLLEPERLQELVTGLTAATTRWTGLRLAISALACDLELLEPLLDPAAPLDSLVRPVIADLEQLQGLRSRPTKKQEQAATKQALLAPLATPAGLALFLGWRLLAAGGPAPEVVLAERFCDEIFDHLSEAEQPGAASASQLLPVLVRHGAVLAGPDELPAALVPLLDDPAVVRLLEIHSWQGEQFLSRERLLQLCAWLPLGALLAGLPSAALADRQAQLATLCDVAAECGYRVEKIFDIG